MYEVSLASAFLLLLSKPGKKIECRAWIQGAGSVNYDIDYIPVSTIAPSRPTTETHCYSSQVHS